MVVQYDALLAPFAIGEYGMAEPDMGAARLAVRRRQAQAAEQRGWRLVFLPSEGEGLVFRVGTEG